MKQNPNQRRSRGRGMVRQGRPGGNGRLTLVHDGQVVDVRARGAYTQAHEKYLLLAREAQSSGDRVAAEGFYQHAEHYFRMLALITAAEQERRTLEAAAHAEHHRSTASLPSASSPNMAGSSESVGESAGTDEATDDSTTDQDAQDETADEAL